MSEEPKAKVAWECEGCGSDCEEGDTFCEFCAWIEDMKESLS